MSEKSISFYKNLDNTVWGTISPVWANRNASFGSRSVEINVPTVSIWSYFESIGIPYYLKIDIEGVDLVCLQALLDFDDRPMYVSLESEKVNFESLLTEFKLLEQLGYDNFKVVNQALVHLQVEPNPSHEGEFLNYKFNLGSSGLFGSDLGSDWVSAEQAVRLYKWIFLGYRLFGDRSRLSHLAVVKKLRQLVGRLTGTEVPGWYDTHARHSSFQG